MKLGRLGRRGLTLAMFAVVGLGACGRSDPGARKVETLDDSALAAFVDSTLDLSPLIYDLGGQTLNDQCPVRRARLNRRMPAIYVNQHPVGFC